LARARHLLLALAIALVAALSLGCGDSNDFVVTGNNNNPNPDGGTLTFRFVKAQAAQEVPQSTVNIRFEWLDSNSALLRTDTEPFAQTITLVPPTGTGSVRITPLTSEGFPLLTLTGAVTIPANGTNVDVDLSTFTEVIVNLTLLVATPDPVSVTVGGGASSSQQLTLTGTFSNNDVVTFPASAVARTTFTPDNSGSFAVSDTGLVSAVSAGTGSLGVSFTDPQGNVVNDTVTVNVTGGGQTPASLTVTPDPLVVAPGSTSGALTATYTPAGGSPVVVANSDVDFSITGSGFSVSTSGTVSVANNVPLGTSTTLSATYSAGGTTVTDTITVNANLPTVVSRQFLNPAGDLELPVNFFYNLAASETYSDGSTRQVFEPEGLGYAFSVGNSAVANVEEGTLETASSAGNTTVTLSYQGQAVDSFALTVSNTTVTGILVSPDSFLLTPESIVPYTVTATYANGRTANIAASPLLESRQAEGERLDVQFQDGLAYGGVNIGNATQTFSLNTTNGVVSDNVTVTQAAGFVTDLQATVGGLTSGQVPQDLTALVDVHATLTDGTVRRLSARPLNYGSRRSGLGDSSEFLITPEDGDTDTFTISNNQLQPGTNHEIGNSESFVISPRNGYVLAPGASNTTITLSVVSSQAGSATASFTNYSDDDVVLQDLARPVTIAFSNTFVQGFQVAGRDLILADNSRQSTGLTVDEDIWGFPLLDDLDEASVPGFGGSITYQVFPNNGNQQFLATAVQTIRIFELTAQPTFVPASLILNPGQTRSVDLQVSARESQGAPTVVFNRTLDFLYGSRSGRVDLTESNGSLDVRASSYGTRETVNLFEYDRDRLPSSLSVTIRPSGEDR
jgi:hypothetical protein